jgi:hypothetical protein
MEALPPKLWTQYFAQANDKLGCSAQVFGSCACFGGYLLGRNTIFLSPQPKLQNTNHLHVKSEDFQSPDRAQRHLI